MSNPGINRWGLNLFWYRYWYTDKNYFLSLQQDHLMNKLVHTYLNFGLFFPVNIFIHKYWYKKFSYKNYYNEHSAKYFRVMSFKNLITHEISYYNERVKIENIYQSRIWILKFQQWILINFYCFNPLKKRHINQANRSLKVLDLDTYAHSKKKNYFMFKRIKLMFFFFIKKKTSKTFFYNF